MNSPAKLSFYLGPGSGNGSSPAKGASPTSPNATSGGGRKFPSLSAKARWHDVMKKMKLQMAHLGRSPMVPVSKIETLKELFTDPRTGKLIELDHDTFCQKMSDSLSGRNFTQDELSKWFSDMDVDLSNSVSWEEFTSFMISAASSFGEENVRSKEFLPDLMAGTPTTVMHKDSVKRLVTNRMSPYVVSGGYDGLVKLWRPRDGSHVFSINNNIYSAAHEAIPAGSVVPVSAIMDIAFNMRGTHCFVAAADKSVNIYDGKTFSLTRKFVGVVADSIETAYWKANHLGCDGVPDVNSRRSAAAASGIVTSFRSVENAEVSLLLSMTEAPSTLDIATPHENEVLFFGTHDGSIMAYPSLRHSVLPDIPKLAHFKDIHKEPISKMRYEPTLRALITASWDTSICLTSPETGQCIHRLPGHQQQAMDYGSNMVSDSIDIGHKKIALDFAFTSTHHLLATVGADRTVLLWNPMFRLPVASLRGHSAPLCSVAVDDIDNLLISMDISGVVKTWDLRMNRCLQTIGGSGSESGGGGSAPSQASATSASVECKLDTPSAMIYAPEHHRIFCAGRSLSSYTVRRAQTHFHPTHIGHCEGIISYAAFPDTSSIVTADANVLMRWNVRNGRRQSLWDINPPSADGGDMLTRTSDASSGGLQMSSQKMGAPHHSNHRTGGNGKQVEHDGVAAAAAAANKISTIACFDRDSSQRRIFAVTMDGALISFNPSNGQELRRMELANYLSDEPFRVMHLSNAHNTMRTIAVITAREAIFVSEDVDEVTGLMPFGPYGRVLAPPTTAVTTSTNSDATAKRVGPVQQCFFSAVATYPPVGASTLPSLVLGSTEGHLQVVFPLSQECTSSVMHPPPRSNTRQSSHRRHRRSTTTSTTTTAMMNATGTSVASSSTAALVSSAVEDIVYLRSLDLFITCVGDNHMFFWDLRNGQLKLQFCTNLQPEECILSLASGEDSEPFVSYDTALSKKGAAATGATFNPGGGGGGGVGGVTLKHMIKKRQQAGAAGGILNVKGSIKSFAQLLEEALTVRTDGTLGLIVDTEGRIGEAQSGYITDNLVDDEERRQKAVENKQKHEHAASTQNARRQHRLLISGCDWGFVYVWDVSRLPTSTAPVSSFLGGVPLHHQPQQQGISTSAVPPAAAVSAYAPPVLLSVFRAHNAPITRLSFFHSERLLCTMSTVDCYVKTFHLKGSYVGHFGQRMPYWFRDATTFAADAFSVAMEDTSQQTPRYPPQSAPSSSLAATGTANSRSLRQGRHSGSPVPVPNVGGGGGGLQAPRDTPNIPMTSAAITGGAATSRPSTRQLESPAASLFNSSFFATSVPRPLLGKHSVESPQELSSFAQIPAGVDVFDGAAASMNGALSPSFAGSGSKKSFALPGASSSSRRRASLGAAPDTSNRSPLADSDRATPGEFGEVHAASSWTSPTDCLSDAELKAARAASNSVAPRGLTTKDGESTLRPLLFRKKRLSIRATSTETIDEVRQRKPRHTASVVGDLFMMRKARAQSGGGAHDVGDQHDEGDDGIHNISNITATTTGASPFEARRRSFGRRRGSREDIQLSDATAAVSILGHPSPGGAGADNNLDGITAAFTSFSRRRGSRSSSPMQALEPLMVPVFLADDDPMPHRSTPTAAVVVAAHSTDRGDVSVKATPQYSLVVPAPALRSLMRTPGGASDGGGSSGKASPIPHSTTQLLQQPPQSPSASMLMTPGRVASSSSIATSKPPPSPKVSVFGSGVFGTITPMAQVSGDHHLPANMTPRDGVHANVAGGFTSPSSFLKKPPLAPPPAAASPLGMLVVPGVGNYLHSNSSSAFVTPRPCSRDSPGRQQRTLSFDHNNNDDRVGQGDHHAMGITPPEPLSGIPLLHYRETSRSHVRGSGEALDDVDALFSQWSTTAAAEPREAMGRGGDRGVTSFLLTALGDDDDDDDGGGEHHRTCARSNSVPLSRRLPQSVSVLARSSEKYRSRTSLSMLPVTSPSPTHTNGGKSLFGSPAASYTSFPSASSPIPSPSSSPRRRVPQFVGGFDRSVVHKTTAILHNAVVARSNRKSATENRVDHVTRLIRDRELLKYQPLLIRPSLLQDNEVMKEEVEIMPTAWTSRASSLLKTHDFELQDIQRRFWSPKAKEISKSKLLKWNTGPNSLFGADPRKQAQQQQQQQQQQGQQ